MTAIFVILPHQLSEVLGFIGTSAGFGLFAVIIYWFCRSDTLYYYCWKKRKMRQVFLAAIALMTAALALLALGSQVGVGIILGLLLYFMGFNLLEATIPSWISKRAPVANKATAMGLNSSSQFFGAFVGGAMGRLIIDPAKSVGMGYL